VKTEIDRDRDDVFARVRRRRRDARRRRQTRRHPAGHATSRPIRLLQLEHEVWHRLAVGEPTRGEVDDQPAQIASADVHVPGDNGDGFRRARIGRLGPRRGDEGRPNRVAPSAEHSTIVGAVRRHPFDRLRRWQSVNADHGRAGSRRRMHLQPDRSSASGGQHGCDARLSEDSAKIRSTHMSPHAPYREQIDEG